MSMFSPEARGNIGWHLLLKNKKFYWRDTCGVVYGLILHSSYHEYVLNTNIHIHYADLMIKLSDADLLILNLKDEKIYKGPEAIPVKNKSGKLIYSITIVCLSKEANKVSITHKRATPVW